MSVSPVAKGLFDRRHNPMWTIQPSPTRSRRCSRSGGRPATTARSVYDLTDPEWNTRFLGDLYQDLSEAARKTYALLQTPEFVEEFILKYTLDPAIEEFGLEPAPPVGHEDLPHRLRVIDPACGSGHFLLGAFRKPAGGVGNGDSPATDKWELVRKALSSVHGVDKNPFAVAIARFRLMLAAMRAGGVERLTRARRLPAQHRGRRLPAPRQGRPGPAGGVRLRRRKRRMDLPHRGRRRLHQVLPHPGIRHVPRGGGNPPYITVKDKAENESYRKAYDELSGAVRIVGPVCGADLPAGGP